jgi:cytochrome c oxidase subunit 2
MPQARVEIVNPTRLHLGGEFVETNLGSAVEPDGSVTVRAIGQEYSFTPECILVPTDTAITFRAATPDVIHGFLIEGTNVNTMLVPGYVATVHARFDAAGEHAMPCQEFCGWS